MNATASYYPAVYAAGSPVPNRRTFALLAVLIALIAVYGSVVPLHLHRQSFAEAIARFRLVLAQPIVVQSRSDWLANFLLLLPFGFFLMAAICCDRPYFAVPALPLTIVACCVLAAFVEFAQLYFPPRVSSINDIAAQTVGGTTGAVFWLLRGQRSTVLARRLWSDFGSRSTAGPLLGLYLFVLLIVQTLPFDFTLSPVEIYHKYKEGRVHLLPFAAPGVAGFELADKHFWNAALFAPVGVLLAYLPGRGARNGVVVLGFGLLAAAAIELAQLLAFSRYCDTTDILTGGASVFAAWLVARRCLDSRLIVSRGLLLIACLAVLIFMEWQPFDFAPSLSAARVRLHQVSLLPFLDYLRGNYLNSLDDAIHKILLFVPLGALLSPAVPASRTAILFRWSLAVAVAVVLETGQLFLPTRYASVTDVLVGSIAAGIGLLVRNRFQSQLNGERA
jgi:glycopeptide antibiotics resistance protein